VRRNLSRAAALAFAAGAASAAMANATEYPYCSAGGGFSSHGSCGFSSLEQCRATVMGAGGYCHVNPAYDASNRMAPASKTPIPLRSREVGFQRHR
jgi:Protein of unknown function (DUF3551)